MEKNTKIFLIGAGCGAGAGIGGTLLVMKARQRKAQQAIEQATATMLNTVEQAVQEKAETTENK